MGNYLSSVQISDHPELPEQQVYEISDIPEKNIRQPKIVPEFYKSKKNNKFASLENAIGLNKSSQFSKE
jgi:hypothetical protein